MLRLSVSAIVVLVLADALLADTYTVTNDDDSGTGSLRWAIGRANSHAGADVITFAAHLSGSIIQPLTPLPAITDDATVVDGDLNNDGAPDVSVDGNLVDDPAAYPAIGLAVVGADDCVIRGMVLTRWNGAGVSLTRSLRSRVTSCHVGVNRGGTRAFPNRGIADIDLNDSSDCVIGSSSLTGRNVLAGGWADPLHAACAEGVNIDSGDRNLIRGNYIGLRRDGGVLGDGHVGSTGVRVLGGTGNEVGGTVAGRGNAIGGVDYGVMVTGGASDTVIAGNLLGLAADGSTLASVARDCVCLDSVYDRVTIGGATAAARNVFAGGASYGIYITYNAWARVLIQGNYFGMNAAGTAERGLSTGIFEGSAGNDVLIGGPEAGHRNYFTPYALAGGVGIHVRRGSEPVIRGNTIGQLPGGGAATAMTAAIYIRQGAEPTVRENTIANALLAGVQVNGDEQGSPVLRGNQFKKCTRAVYLMNGGACILGDLGNALQNDNGHNVFDPSNKWHIYNATTNDIKAEGNDFGTIVDAKISAKIYDQVDNGNMGLVDFDPLLGGFAPTAATSTLTISSTSAAPTGQGGAQVSLTLSADARVELTIANIAGRMVRRVVTDHSGVTGLNTLVWDGKADSGLRVPAGRYLVQVRARTEDGRQCQAMTAVRLAR